MPVIVEYHPYRKRDLSAIGTAAPTHESSDVLPGSPVLADCARTNSSGVCVPVPIGSVALM